MAALSKESSETTTKIEATLARAVKYETISRSRPSYRLVGLVVIRPPRERKIPGSNPAYHVDFFFTLLLFVFVYDNRCITRIVFIINCNCD